MARNTLHITNGDSAAALMRDAGIAGVILPWRDVLHDGPVPAGLDLDALAEVRADFLAQPPLINRQEVLDSFRERDDLVRNWQDFERVVIWLEHDLYDQLQLLQILDAYAKLELPEGFVSLICIDRFPGVEPFYGLGQLTPDQIGSLRDSQIPVTSTQFRLAEEGWAAFRESRPGALLRFLDQTLSPLAFMRAALLRHCEEFPDSRTGLGKHQRQILELVEGGVQRPGHLFAEHQKREAAPYLGDWSFFGLIRKLTNVAHPLLETATGQPFQESHEYPPSQAFRDQRLSLTSLGNAVLVGRQDWLELEPPDYWKGGVHLHPDKTIWRWGAENQIFVG